MRFFYSIKDFFHRIRLFFERGRKGYTNEDWWSIRDWLIDNLAPQLDYWSKHAHSYPNDIDGIESFEEWSKFLKESADALKEFREIDEKDPFLSTSKYKKQYKDCSKKIKRFFTILGKYFGTFWD